MTLTSKRFEWISAGQDNGPDALSDVPLFVNSKVVVLPTLGAIVPNWVLAVPRECSVSLAALSKTSRAHVVAAANWAASVMDAGEGTTFFEHGPSNDGSIVGCGVDQAHLHVIASELDFVSSALNDPNVNWTSADIDNPWSGIGDREYYLVQTRSKAFVGYPRIPVSQFFRRHIAKAVGASERWDYKVWPNYENVRRTYEYFNGCVRADAV